MQLRNKLHPLMLLPDNLSRLAKKYGHFQVEIPLDVFCRDLSKFTQFQPWQLHQALYKMLNSETISWSSFLQLLKDDCKTRSNLITELLDQNQSFCFSLDQEKFERLNEDLKLSDKEDIRQFNRIFLFNYSFSMLMLDDQLLIVEEKEQSIVSKLFFNPISQERDPIPVLNPEKEMEKEKSKERLDQVKKQKGKIVDFPSQILQQGLRSSKRNSSNLKTSGKAEKKPLESLLDLSLDQSNIHIGKSFVNEAFDATVRYPATTHAHPSLTKTQFNPWRFVSNMKTLRTELSYNPHHIPLEHRIKSIQTPKDKQVFNRALTLNKKIATSNIPIESFSVNMDYVAVILKNKELRLLKLKKYPFNKIVTNVVLTKTFKWFPVYIHLFRTILNDNLHILVAFQLDKKAKIKAFKLVQEEDKKTEICQIKLVEMYSEEVNFSPIYQPMKNYFGMYDEFGRLLVLDLTCRDSDSLSIKFNTKIQNPYLNKTIPISACTYHAETFTLVIGCKNGYLHTLSQHSPEPKRHKKITNKRQISALVCGLEYVVVLTIDGICLLVNPYSLNEMNRIDLNEHDIRKVFSLYKIEDRDSILVYGKTIQQLNLVTNKDKIKQIRRSKYQHLTKVKLLDCELPPVEAITHDTIHKVKISQDYLIVVLESSNLVKVFSSLTGSTSFIPNKETSSIIDLAMEKKGNLIGIAYDNFDVEVRNIYNQNLLWSVALNDFPNCLIFITKDHTPMINVNTEEGNVNLIDSKGTLKTIYNTKTSLTAAIQTKSNLIVGDCFGSIYIFSETSMMLLHQINLKNSQGIKLFKDIPKLKYIRVLTFGNTIYDIDIQNGRMVFSVSPKCEMDETIHDITDTGFIQQTAKGIFVGEFVQNKEKIPLRTRISSRSKYPSAEMMAKSILRMASNSITLDDHANISEEKFIHYQELNIQKDKIKGVYTVMNRLAVLLSNCTSVYIDNLKKVETVNLLL